MTAPAPNAQAEVVELLGRPDSHRYLEPDSSRASRGRMGGGQARRGRHLVADHRGRAGPGLHRRPRRGRRPEPPPLLIHGHLDVVPAEPKEWSVDPFGGEIRDGYLWGRGAIDMKDMDAMTLAAGAGWARTGRKPPRDIVLAFVSDEEAGGRLGAHHLVDHHPDLFADCTEAIGEVGGFSVSLNDSRRLYLIQTAEKGIDWLRLRATGRAGHGSMIHDDNAVTAAGRRRSRASAPTSSRSCSPTPSGPSSNPSRRSPGSTSTRTTRGRGCPSSAAWPACMGAAIRNTANPTMLDGRLQGQRHPVERRGDHRRPVPARRGGRLLAMIDELVGPGIERESIVRDIAVETTFDGALVEAMSAALRAEDAGAHPVPYLMSGGTDAKSFSTLGIRCFGFSPLLLPADLDFTALFHGIDERVPVDGLEFGVRVLDRLLTTC